MIDYVIFIVENVECKKGQLAQFSLTLKYMPMPTAQILAE